MGWIVRKLKSWYRELCHGSQVVVKNKLRKGDWLDGKDAASNSISSSGDTATKNLSLTSTQATDDSINFGFLDDSHFQNIEIEIPEVRLLLLVRPFFFFFSKPQQPFSLTSSGQRRVLVDEICYAGVALRLGLPLVLPHGLVWVLHNLGTKSTGECVQVPCQKPDR